MTLQQLIDKLEELKVHYTPDIEVRYNSDYTSSEIEYVDLSKPSAADINFNSVTMSYIMIS